MTGMSEKALKRAGMAYEKVYVHPSSHAGYYPGAMPLSLKLLFDPETGKILGAQAVGADGVDKRIDVLAVAIRAGLTVRDLADQELCYAPPYGSAKDPINYAGFVATNVLDGDARLCHADDVIDPAENQLLLDVRNPDEVLAGTIPGAMNIPLDQLRERLDELPRDKEILAFCQAGLRGYLACRILSLNGFSCRNLSGGYKTYQAAVGQLPMGRGGAARDARRRRRRGRSPRRPEIVRPRWSRRSTPGRFNVPGRSCGCARRWTASRWARRWRSRRPIRAFRPTSRPGATARATNCWR